MLFHAPATARPRIFQRLVMESAWVLVSSALRLMLSSVSLRETRTAQKKLTQQSVTTLDNHFKLKEQEQNLLFPQVTGILGLAASSLAILTLLTILGLDYLRPSQSLRAPFVFLTTFALMDIVFQSIAFSTSHQPLYMLVEWPCLTIVLYPIYFLELIFSLDALEDRP